MSDTTNNGQKRPWFDATINLQTLFTGVVGASIALAVAYFTLVQRVSLIEADVVNLKSSQHDKEVQTQNSLTEIKGSVQNTNEKIDKLTNFLLQNSVGERADTKRWAK